MNRTVNAHRSIAAIAAAAVAFAITPLMTGTITSPATGTRSHVQHVVAISAGTPTTAGTLTLDGPPWGMTLS